MGFSVTPSTTGIHVSHKLSFMLLCSHAEQRGTNLISHKEVYSRRSRTKFSSPALLARELHEQSVGSSIGSSSRMIRFPGISPLR